MFPILFFFCCIRVIRQTHTETQYAQWSFSFVRNNCIDVCCVVSSNDFFCRNIAKIISRIKSIIAIYAQPNVRQPSSDSEKQDVTIRFTYNVSGVFNLFCFIKLHIIWIFVGVLQDLLCQLIITCLLKFLQKSLVKHCQFP